MTPPQSITLEILQCAAEGRPVELGPPVEALLPGLILGGYLTIDNIGGIPTPKLTSTGEVVYPVLTPKGQDLLDTFR